MKKMQAKIQNRTPDTAARDGEAPALPLADEKKGDAPSNLFGLTLTGCSALMRDLGEPKFRSRQLFEWLYVKRAMAVDACTNLPKKLRETLKARWIIDWGEVLEVQADPEDGTKKMLIRLADGECVETVLMAYDYGYSLCVSSQVGCAMGCAFCASTRGGVVRDLTAGEMAAQIALVEAAEGIRISRVVVMGIGEPLANYDNLLRFIQILSQGFSIGMRRITVSTCGIVPMIERLADEALEINLAISLHSPDQAVREQIMPVARHYPLDQLLKTCKNYFNKTGRRVTFEYALMAGVNDRDEDAKALIRLFSGENVHLNLIRLNPITDGPFAGSQNVTVFAKKLKTGGINCTIRRRIGKNIDAACGQLRHRQAQAVPMVTKPRGER